MAETDRTARLGPVDPIGPDQMMGIVQCPDAYDVESRQAFFTGTCLALAFCAVRTAEDPLVLSMRATASPELRCGVAVLVFNPAGDVFIVQAGEEPVAAWRLPQGEVGADVTPFEAAQQLLRDEARMISIDPITQGYGWLRYEFIAEPQPAPKSGQLAGYQQKWLAFRFTGNADELAPTKPSMFSACRWAPLHELPYLIAPFRRPRFKDVVQMLRGRPDERP